MTARQPRRTRRRSVPAATLPRPLAGDSPVTRDITPRAAASRHREHHVTTDYSYVRRDLITVAGVGAVVIAFIVAMSFVL